MNEAIIQCSIIDEIFNYRSNYTGFTIKQNSGTVKLLAYKFNVTTDFVIMVLNQMITDEMLVELGMFGFDMTYGPIQEK